MKKEQIKRIEIYKEIINRGIEDLLEIAEALPDQRLSELDDFVLELDDLKVGIDQAVIALLRSTRAAEQSLSEKIMPEDSLGKYPERGKSKEL